jgi:hypothetical protein
VDTLRNPFKEDTQQATTHPESGFPFFSTRGHYRAATVDRNSSPIQPLRDSLYIRA